MLMLIVVICGLFLLVGGNLTPAVLVIGVLLLVLLGLGNVGSKGSSSSYRHKGNDDGLRTRHIDSERRR